MQSAPMSSDHRIRPANPSVQPSGLTSQSSHDDYCPLANVILFITTVIMLLGYFLLYYYFSFYIKNIVFFLLLIQLTHLSIIYLIILIMLNEVSYFLFFKLQLLSHLLITK